MTQQERDTAKREKINAVRDTISTIIETNGMKWTDLDMCEFLDWRDKDFSPYQDSTQTTALDLGWHRDIDTNKFYRTTELLQLFIAHKKSEWQINTVQKIADTTHHQTQEGKDNELIEKYSGNKSKQ